MTRIALLVRVGLVLSKTATSGREIVGRDNLGICNFFILLASHLTHLVQSYHFIHNSQCSKIMRFSNGFRLDSIGCLWQELQELKSIRFLQIKLNSLEGLQQRRR